MANEARKCILVHFRAKLSLNGIHAYGAQGMDEFEGQRKLGISFKDEETSLRQRR